MNELPDILAEIIAHKETELEQAMTDVPIEELRRQAADAPPVRSMRAALTRTRGEAIRVIGEIKRRSPSAGAIRPDVEPGPMAGLLQSAGVDALSVLTDRKYFGGSADFLREARAAATVPILRKDFIVDPYQVWEARAWGADAVLLIADALDVERLRDLVSLGRELGLESLVESHDPAALARAVDCGAVLLGINNRNLHSFEVDLDTTVRLAPQMPEGCILVSESGICTSADVSKLLASGAHAVLVGESLMRAADPAEFVRQLKSAR